MSKRTPEEKREYQAGYRDGLRGLAKRSEHPRYLHAYALASSRTPGHPTPTRKARGLVAACPACRTTTGWDGMGDGVIQCRSCGHRGRRASHEPACRGCGKEKTTHVNMGSGWSCLACGSLLHTVDGKPEGKPTHNYRLAGWTVRPRSAKEWRDMHAGKPEPRRRPLARRRDGVAPCTVCLSVDFDLARQSAKPLNLVRYCVPCHRRRDAAYRRRRRASG